MKKKFTPFQFFLKMVIITGVIAVTLTFIIANSTLLQEFPVILLLCFVPGIIMILHWKFRPKYK